MLRGRLRRPSIVAVLILLLGCAGLPAAQPSPPPGASTERGTTSELANEYGSPTSLPATSTPSRSSWPTPAGWHNIYTRPGFDGQRSVDLRAAGDIMLARNVEHILRKRPAGWLFGPSANLLRGDVVVGNLESPFTTRRRPDQLRPGPYRLPADPALVSQLAPFTALSLANNHALDAGPQGLADAQRILGEAHIGVLGVTGGACGKADPVLAGSESPLNN